MKNEVRIRDKGWNQIKRELQKLDGHSVKSGLIRGRAPQDVIDRGVWNEFGTHRDGSQHIPPRPFIAHTADSHKRAWFSIAKTTYNLILKQRATHRIVFDALETKMQNDIQRSITNWSQPPNAPSTIAQKGFNDPLVHTGAMRDSIASETVEDE